MIAPGREFDYFLVVFLPGSRDWMPKFEHSISLGDDYGPDEIPAGRKGSAQDIAGIILFFGWERWCVY